MGKLEDICDRYLSRRDEQKKVIEAVNRCLSKGYDYEKLRERVQNAVEDSHKASKVTSAICDYYPQLRKRTRNDRDEDRDRDRKRDRVDDRNGDRRDRESSRRVERPPEVPTSEPPKSEEVKVPGNSSVEEQLRAKEMMYKAQQEIEEKKRTGPGCCWE
ncbi:hypothetical protein L5515_003721 [Caenorhabditis briggsae]|uniref:Uncharacterized protein n=1 Tax=Caenorhabditis briggsae TaxID=6238 RepID=A0AAE9DAH4_CAEBR|nr:hypothetical protein L3Y34_000864 [Caenorhabditis briggsae]UMM22576.1 hypothetical protein L5515_003721 [Caenorhabditis briggsae]